MLTLRDPKDTGASEHSCYFAYNPGETAAFPFHEACYALFSRSLGFRHTKQVDNDMLYDILESHRSSEVAQTLDLNYGLIEHPKQFWECKPGFEYCVADPSPVPEFWQVCCQEMPPIIFGGRSTGPDLSHKIQTDPFDRLPTDIIQNIIEQSDLNDTLALREASWYVHAWTKRHHKQFGLQMIRLHLSPWLWEMDDLLSSATSSECNVDFTKLFFWIESITEPRFGMRGTFMGMANRWRIWDACQQMLYDYQERCKA